MIRLGITGQSGFIGQHLYNTIALFPEEFEKIEYDISFFEDESLLNDFVSRCDVIVHLAAMNRHNDPQVVYDVNMGIVKKLITALEFTESKAHVLFSSSSQEELGNLYGKSKKDGREFLAAWARRTGGKFTGMVIPNVFGPFGNPYYNSFIATFSHQLTHNEQPKIEVDGSVKLIYIADLIEQFIHKIRSCIYSDLLKIPHTAEYKVSKILELLNGYKQQYFNAGIIPGFNNLFERDLFNTFRCYMDIKHYFPVAFSKHTDERGMFVELIKLQNGGQISFSTTVSGITRGNHYHTRKIERFAVIKGEALIKLRRIGTTEVIDFYLSGDKPSYVDMPIWYTHNIKNIGREDLYTIFWINEFYNQADSDTYFEIV